MTAGSAFERAIDLRHLARRVVAAAVFAVTLVALTASQPVSAAAGFLGYDCVTNDYDDSDYLFENGSEAVVRNCSESSEFLATPRPDLAEFQKRLSDFVAPRTTPGTAIEPMWAQAPNRGFLGGWSRPDTLPSGTVIDRYGGETGRFFSPQGTPLDARALPTGSGPLNTYEVLKPLDVQGGVVAPAFGQPGLGVQYMTDLPVADLIEQGFLKPVG